MALKLNDKPPLVTIISLVYNTGVLNIRAFETLRLQTYKNYEHIIIDDCSTDNSLLIIKNWIKENNHKCIILQNNENLGITKSLNRALKIANGTYWAGIGDDLWMPEHLMINVLKLENEEFKNCGLIYSRLNVSVNGKTNYYWSPQIRLKDAGVSNIEIEKYFPMDRIDIVVKKNDFFNLLFYCNIFHPVSALFKFDITKELGFFDEQLEFEDWDFAFRLSEKYDILYSNSISSTYLIHGDNYTVKRYVDLNYGKLQTLLKHKPEVSSDHLQLIRNKQMKDLSISIFEHFLNRRKIFPIMKHFFYLMYIYKLNIGILPKFILKKYFISKYSR